MKLFRKLMLTASLLLAFVPAQADIIATGEFHRAPIQSATPDSAALRQQVLRQLIDNGVDAELAGGRVAAMTDAQLVALDGKMAELPADAGISTIYLLLIIIILVLLL